MPQRHPRAAVPKDTTAGRIGSWFICKINQSEASQPFVAGSNDVNTRHQYRSRRLFLTEELEFPFYFLSAVLDPSFNHRQDEDVLQYCEMGRSSGLRHRFRSSVIWHPCYAEHERHLLCQSLILQDPAFVRCFLLLLTTAIPIGLAVQIICTSLILPKATQSDKT
jgi:hypothetical protein